LLSVATAFSLPLCLPPRPLPSLSLSFSQFLEYEHVSQALSLHYIPLHDVIPPSSFTAKLWIDYSPVIDTIYRALGVTPPPPPPPAPPTEAGEWGEAARGGEEERQEEVIMTAEMALNRAMKSSSMAAAATATAANVV